MNVRGVGRYALVAGLIAGSIGIAGCGDGSGDSPVIAFAFPEWTSVEVRLARTVLAARGIDVEIIWDSLASGYEARELTLDLARRYTDNSRVVGVVGHSSSSNSLAAVPLYNEAGIPTIVPTATSRLLSRIGDYVFTLAASDSAEAEFMAAVLTGDRIEGRSVTVFYVDDPYGTGLRDFLLPALAARNVEVFDVVRVRSAVSAGRGSLPRDFESLVESALQGGTPEVVVLLTRDTEAASIMRFVNARVPEAAFFVSDGVDISAAVRQWADGVSATVYSVGFWNPEDERPETVAFRRQVRESGWRGATPTGGMAMRHDAVMLMATAIDEVGPSREALRAYLEELGRARPPYEGVTGAIRFDDVEPRLHLLEYRLGER